MQALPIRNHNRHIRIQLDNPLRPPAYAFSRARVMLKSSTDSFSMLVSQFEESNINSLASPRQPFSPISREREFLGLRSKCRIVAQLSLRSSRKPVGKDRFVGLFSYQCFCVKNLNKGYRAWGVKWHLIEITRNHLSTTDKTFGR